MNVNRPTLTLAVMLISASAWFSPTARAQAEVQASPNIEPKAQEAFRASADLLAKAKSMSFKADVSRDVVLAYGQKLQLSNQREITVFRPGSLRGSNEGDLDRVDYWLHNGQLCVLDNNHGVYAKLDTPATIDATLDKLALEHGLIMPLADFLVADPYESAMANVDSAGYAGLHLVRGIACHHLVFRQPGLDWQLWINAGSQPLPVRMVITFTDLPHAPQWMADFHDWDLNPKLEEGMFTFEAPEGTREVSFDELASLSAAIETRDNGEASP